ncbi:MAG: transcription elongation factor GreA [bacterium]|nr:transcription elongation factor GreA [bacterium]
MITKIPFTQEGYDKIVAELAELTGSKRQAAVTRLALARSMGDLSENSEYQAAKEEHAFVEGRIKEIEELMKRAEVSSTQATSGIDLGNTVVVVKDGVESTYTIVGEFEADPLEKKLSSTSPIGKALLGRKVRDTVNVEVPAGTLKFKIIKINK